MPLYDIELTKKMISAHESNLADFTFAENYPSGFSPYVLNRATFKKLFLISTGNNSIYEYNTLKALIDLDINSYDVEILSPEEDLRFIRETFSTSNKRSFLLTKNFFINDINSNNILEKLKEKPEILRPLPSYITIELSSKCNQSCVFCPYPKIKKDSFIKLDIIKLLSEISSWIEEGYIEFSGIGEPFTYPDFETVLDLIRKNPKIHFIIETNGSLLKPWIEKLKDINNLTIIVLINASNKEDYKRIHGADDFNIVESNIEQMIKNKIDVYLQFVRCRDTETNLDGFIKRWEFMKDKIIIRKYNDFSGFLEDKKIVDLSPLNRFPCWKLQRNIFIDSQGYLRPCYQDINNNFGFDLNILSIQEAWENLNHLYKRHWDNIFDSVCNNCDEWYVFDF